LASVEKELQHVKMNNATLARYINAKRKEDDRRKEEAHKKTKAPKSSSLLLVIFE
jgi:hypothetical protein